MASGEVSLSSNPSPTSYGGCDLGQVTYLLRVNFAMTASLGRGPWESQGWSAPAVSGQGHMCPCISPQPPGGVAPGERPNTVGTRQDRSQGTACLPFLQFLSLQHTQH